MAKITPLDFVMVAMRKKHGIRKAAEAAGKFARDEAVKRAPVDKGKLEESIMYEVTGDDNSVNVSIRIKKGRKANAYATKMHEDHYNLGPRSQEKNSKSDVVVGRKYLERAFDENVDEILRIVGGKLREEFK
ncbi:HK97 gp10 family phage protein [Pseudodesulfovibrio thermohalotolerans]|uniref:HK97 gp10 family phage protein n=1 Tax=Pseudodesulfovibrio thermohalotolerans TaxID=2880651 RepID=UPI0022BA02AA|nr:HK97 gp10 family phage protein [Pseudodesulfovibrio thermohalotolerans]WFS64006.1 HK97 gp10 family phage protein [Pseudodesulfovibrio thermohalotolerans]